MAREFTFGAGPERLRRLLFEGLEEPQGEQDAERSTLGRPAQSEGDWIGPYKLLRVLGEGGMGIVYLAEQAEPIKRRVALKVIKPGMDSKRVIARFEAERQALALLDHPNIARVHDAGATEAGRPYFVMEYVEGLPITDHCDNHKLTIDQRLRVFQQVCEAVQHAHQKGIIHRDLKPSNILVATEGDKAIPKIIDFGVAKAIAAPLTERTLATEDSRLLGTPEYMSPEQADMATEDIDTRSDVYSLGVLLYVLLTGALPFDSDTLRTGGIEHIRQVIRETDPKTPSTRLTKLGDEARKLAESRRTEVGALAKRLHKELEWIPLKAMRKDRAERYRSAAELADDIENYLHGAPLIAGPLGPGYRLRKFVRRNRVLVGGIAAVLVVLLAGVVVSTTFAIRAERARAESELVTDFLEHDVLGAASDANVVQATLVYTLDVASESLAAGKFRDKPLIEARICRTLGQTYRRLGEYEKAEQRFLRLTEIYQQHYGEAHPETLQAMGHIGWVYIKQDRMAEMEQLFARILQVGQGVLGVREQLNAMNGLAVAYYGQGKDEEAELLYEEILRRVRDELGEEEFPLLPVIKGNLVVVYGKLRRLEEAEKLVKEMMAEPGGHARWALARHLGWIYTAQGRYEEAEPLLEGALANSRLELGNRHPDTLTNARVLTDLYMAQRKYAEAATLTEEALQIAREKLREQHPKTLKLLRIRAVLHMKHKEYDEAAKLFHEVLTGRRREKGDDDPSTLEVIRDIGVLHRERADYEEAEKLLTRALAGLQAQLGPDRPICLATKHELAVLYIAKEDYDKAAPLLLEAYSGREGELGPDHLHTIESLNELVNLYESWGKPDEAETWRAKLPQSH